MITTEIISGTISILLGLLIILSSDDIFRSNTTTVLRTESKDVRFNKTKGKYFKASGYIFVILGIAVIILGLFNVFI